MPHLAELSGDGGRRSGRSHPVDALAGTVCMSPASRSVSPREFCVTEASNFLQDVGSGNRADEGLRERQGSDEALVRQYRTGWSDTHIDGEQRRSGREGASVVQVDGSTTWSNETSKSEAKGDGGLRVSKEVMFLVSSFLVLLTSGGLVLGFGPVYSMLVREHQWSERCVDQGNQAPASQSVCAEQEIQLQYVFSTGFLCLSAANAIFGVMLDILGPRVTILVGLGCSIIGNFALAMGDSHNGTGLWIIIGYALIGAGGMGSYLPAFQILQLYRVQGFVCSTLSSLFNCSGYIYMLLQFDGVSRRQFFDLYGGLVICCAVASFLLFPTNNVVEPADFVSAPGFRLEKPNISTPHGLLKALKVELRRPDLWFFAVFFGWISLIFEFAGGAIPGLLVKLADADIESASLFTNVLYPVLVNGTFIYSPAIGFVIDRYGFKPVFIACLVLVQTLIALLLVPSLVLQALTFVVYSMAQACLYSLQFAYIMMCCPPELYGTLQAFMAVISFTFGLLNYIINPWTQTYLDGNCGVMLVLLGFPTLVLYLFIGLVHNAHEETVAVKTTDANRTTELTKLIS